jgi:hypothetical protein
MSVHAILKIEVMTKKSTGRIQDGYIITSAPPESAKKKVNKQPKQILMQLVEIFENLSAANIRPISESARSC